MLLTGNKEKIHWPRNVDKVCSLTLVREISKPDISILSDWQEIIT
jgi:hypothetical protein